VAFLSSAIGTLHHTEMSNLGTIGMTSWLH
jgi:hypothetical protein